MPQAVLDSATYSVAAVAVDDLLQGLVRLHGHTRSVEEVVAIEPAQDQETQLVHKDCSVEWSLAIGTALVRC